MKALETKWPLFRITVAIAGFALSTLLQGCLGLQASNQDQSSQIPTQVLLHSPTALFIANSTDVTASSASPLSTSKRLYERTSSGVKEVRVNDQNGDPISLTVNYVVALSPSWAAAEFSLEGHLKRGLIRLSDGIIFDISDYNIQYAQLRGNNVYVCNWDISSQAGTIYKIDLQTLLATAMNNPEFNPVQCSAPIFNANTGGAYHVENSFVIGNNNTVAAAETNTDVNFFFDDNSIPYDTTTNDISTYGGGGSAGLVYGEDGYVYQIMVGSHASGEYIYQLTFDKSSFTKTPTLVGNNCSNYISAETHYELSDANRYVLCSTGFYKMSAVPNGGVNLAFTALNLSGVGGSLTPVISGDYVYWYDNVSLQRMHLISGASPEVVVTASNVISFEVIAGSVVYVKYITGTDVGTFEVDNPGDTPTQIANSDMGVEQIHPLSF